MRNEILRKALFLSFIVVSFSGCAQELSSIQNVLTKTNKMLSSGSTDMSIPRLSPNQSQALQDQLRSKIGDHNIRQAREEAKEELEKILSVSACYSKYDIHRYLSAYSVAGKQDYLAPMWNMDFHPKSQCLSVIRLDDWKMHAKNAFSFRAMFVSDSSSEGRSVTYLMVKQPEGVWLLK